MPQHLIRRSPTRRENELNSTIVALESGGMVANGHIMWFWSLVTIPVSVFWLRPISKTIRATLEGHRAKKDENDC